MSMIPQQDENNMNAMNNYQYEQVQTTKVDYSHIKKHPYLNKVFCWIEAGNSEDVKKFFDTFPHLLNNFYSPNNWNPFLYAVRYGNMQLINYFKQKNMKASTSGILSSYSVVQTAVYSGEPAILEYVVNNLNISVNPIGCESSPLKMAMKANNPQMVQILAAKGAYYVFGDVYNNLLQKPNMDEQNKYWSLQLKQIPLSMVVEQNVVRDCPIKQTLKYSRVKSIIAMKLYADKLAHSDNKDSKFHSLANILSKQENINMLLRMAVNKGDSILHKSSNNTNQSAQQIGN